MKGKKGDRVRFVVDEREGEAGTIVEVHPGEYDYSVRVDGDGPEETWGANDEDLKFLGEG